MVSPIKRIDASKQNLRSKLQQLGFQIPRIDRSWVDCSIVGNSNGSPIYSKPTSIQGYFSAGEHRCNVPDNRDGTGFGSLDCDVFEVSSECECENGLHLTSTWPDPFESQVSDIERCSDSVPSPATTEIDTDSESHLFVNRDQSQAENICRKRKSISPLKSSNAHCDLLPMPLRGNGSTLRLSSEGCGDDLDFRPICTSERGSSDCLNESRAFEQFGFNNSRTINWSLQSDPIEACTDGDMNYVLHGGGATDVGFQPNKADISKLVQKLENIQHGLAPKQIRMLLTSDMKFCNKIQRTTDAKQLQSCVAAAAQRMGLQSINHVPSANTVENNDAAPSRQKTCCKWFTQK